MVFVTKLPALFQQIGNLLAETEDTKPNGTDVSNSIDSPVTTVMQSMIKTGIASTCINGVIVQNGLTSNQVSCLSLSFMYIRIYEEKNIYCFLRVLEVSISLPLYLFIYLHILFLKALYMALNYLKKMIY